MKVAVGLQKGGTGKSTSAVIIAILLWLITRKRVLLVDADPKSQTTVDWRGIAGDAWPDGITVIQRTSGLARGIRDAMPGHDHLVIDTGGDRDEILEAALEEVELLLAPIAPTGAESRRIPATLQVAGRVALDGNPDLAVLVLLVKVANSHDLDAKQIRDQLTSKGIAVAKTMIPMRKLYSRAFGTFSPDTREYGLYVDLLDELLEDENG